MTGKELSEIISLIFFCKDLQLALEVDGITHLDEVVMRKDKIRQAELEAMGVAFLRFDALLVINKVEVAISEIIEWIEKHEAQHGVSEFVIRKREALANPKERKRK